MKKVLERQNHVLVVLAVGLSVILPAIMNHMLSVSTNQTLTLNEVQYG